MVKEYRLNVKNNLSIRSVSILNYLRDTVQLESYPWG